MEKSDRKRPREESEEQGEESTSAPPPPPYGSQEYWEDRYRRQEQACKLNEEDDEPDPFHAWYFNYEELAPLILPLILGDGGLGASIETALDNVDEKGAPSGPSNSKNDDEANTEQDDGDDQEGQNSNSETQNESEEEFVDIESEDDEDDGPPSRVGLAKDGPIDILEVGCGDVPLGSDLVSGIYELGKSSQASDFSLEKVLKKVVCIDYSQTVIDALMRKSKAATSRGHTRLLEYACEDARSLPYDRESFHFLLEKGTMDAMLSEPKVGADNCRAIVSEMARVVKRRGVYIMDDV